MRVGSICFQDEIIDTVELFGGRSILMHLGWYQQKEKD